ncbi:CCR4-NOT core DEDD RNase subunit, partial [Conglomerata obtusa]
MDNFIVNVWRSNLTEEMRNIRCLLQNYNFISMDTEFPGVVAKPTGNFTSQSAFLYQQLRCNVDLLRIIQLGITLSDHKGNYPSPCTWQFNFTFNLESDMYSQDSIDLLIKAQIDFERHRDEGIDIEDFGDLLITSGMVMTRNIFWVSFHSAYDFGYLVKLMTCNPLPEREEDFFALLNVLFINFYDVKYMMRGSKYLKKGLQEIADDLAVQRKGIQHQAGSDSYLTSLTFFKSRDVLFSGEIENEKNINK